MSAVNRLSKPLKFLTVILAALLMGFMWRARGSHGFGAFWGITAVGGIFTLFIIAFYGNRAKIKYELIPAGAILMGCTVPAWGCAVGMPGGIIGGFTGTSETPATISQGRGALMMLLLGFSLICLYSIFVGTLFSKREYRLYHYVIYIAVFFAVELLVKFTFSHNLMNVFAPEVVSGFKDGIKEAGIDGTVRQAYIHHFNDISWAKNIPFGRSYYECVEHISFAAGAFALLVTSLAVFRDKITFAVSFLINIISALSITAADYFQICNYETSFLSNMSIPASLRVTSWGLWEFFTGFFMGAGIMLIIALLPNEYTSGKKFRSEPCIENKTLRFILNVLMWVFAFVVVPVRAFALRTARMLEEYGYIKDEDLPGIIITAVISVIAGVFLIALFKKNILDKNLPVPFKEKPDRFSAKALLWLSLYYGAVYFFTLDASVPAFIYRTIKSPAHHADMTGIEFFYVYLIAFILFEIIYIPAKKRLTSRR